MICPLNGKDCLVGTCAWWLWDEQVAPIEAEQELEREVFEQERPDKQVGKCALAWIAIVLGKLNETTSRGY